MLDTIKLRSPYLDGATAATIAGSLELRSAVDLARDVVLWEIVRGSLAGSYDHRISVNLHDRELVMVPSTTKGGRPEPVMQECPPYLVVEGSVHKAIVGHNCWGGPTNVAAACRWFVAELGMQLGVALPPADVWQVRKLDWAEVFEIGGVEVQDFLYTLGNATYPRRKVQYYPGLGFMAPGTTTAVKFYAKGPEFQVHDALRLRRYARLGGEIDSASMAGWVGDVQRRAANLLRVEVSVKARKLDDDFSLPIVADFAEVDDEGYPRYLVTVWEREVRKLLREGSHEMREVCTALDVRERLETFYGSTGKRKGQLVNSLYATWMMLSALGEGQVKGRLPEGTFYRHRKLLVDAGISWLGSDIQRVEDGSAGRRFRPSIASPARVTDKLDRVAYIEERYGGLAA